MRIFVAGASGVVGSRLVPLLVARGHDVFGLTRSHARAAAVRQRGAVAVVADGLDRAGLVEAVARAQPDVVVHEMTDLAGGIDVRRFDRSFAATNRLRVEGTDNLLAAARAAGAGRIVAQSFAGWPYARAGGPVKDEDDPLDPRPPARLAASLAAIRHLEEAVGGAGGIVLRYGALYGPGTSIGPGGELLEAVRRRRLPLIGAGSGVWSFLHADDAAAATLAAIERGGRGLYNVVDDEPAPVSEWLPALAAAVGAKPPRRLPSWIGRLAIGQQGVALMTEVRGAANGRAKRELRWEPRYPSWRLGFRNGLAREGEAQPRSSSARASATATS